MEGFVTSAGGEGHTAKNQSPGRVHPMQRLLDNHFLLLFIGVAIPAALYLMWGVMEIANIPIAD
jgi:hypothetical protein